MLQPASTVLARRSAVIKSYLRSGLNIGHIAQVRGVSRQCIHQYIQAAGLQDWYTALRRERQAQLRRRVQKIRSIVRDRRRLWCRFWERVATGPADRCWLWDGSAYGIHRYGRLRVGRWKLYAHRLMLEWKLRRPLRAHALHRCNNPPCVNPAHLYEGDQKQNCDDRARRDPNWYVKPHGNVSSYERAEMRKRYVAGESAVSIWKSYGYSYGTILRQLRDIKKRPRSSPSVDASSPLGTTQGELMDSPVPGTATATSTCSDGAPRLIRRSQE